MDDPPFRAEVIGSLLRPRILKDTATALEGFGPLVESVIDADVTEAAEAAGLR